MYIQVLHHCQMVANEHEKMISQSGIPVFFVDTQGHVNEVCVAVCCSVFQCVAMCVAVFGSMLQCAVVVFPSLCADIAPGDERWGAGVEYHFQELNEPYAP